MPRKRDPIVTVIDYFEQAPMIEVEQALAIVKRTVERRREKAHSTAVPKKKKKPAPTAAPARAAIVATDGLKQ